MGDEGNVSGFNEATEGTFKASVWIGASATVARDFSNAELAKSGKRERLNDPSLVKERRTYLSELSPIGLFLLIKELTAHDGPK